MNEVQTNLYNSVLASNHDINVVRMPNKSGKSFIINTIEARLKKAQIPYTIVRDGSIINSSHISSPQVCLVDDLDIHRKLFFEHIILNLILYKDVRVIATTTDEIQFLPKTNNWYCEFVYVPHIINRARL